MEKMINNILKDIYEVDPTLSKKEEELKKIINKLIAFKPDAKIDARYQNELKTRLLKTFKENKFKSVSGWLFQKRLQLVFGTAISVFGIIALFVLTGPFKGKVSNSNLAYDDHIKNEKLESTEKNTDADIAGKNKEALIASKPKVDANKPDVKEIQEKKAIIERKEKTASPEMPDKTINISGNLDTVTVNSARPEIFKESLSTASSSFDKPGYYDDATGGAVLELEEETAPAPFNVYNEQYDESFWNTEEYDRLYENSFLKAADNPLSTFSIDVDTASYANVRRFISNGQMPYPDAVRIEELINYFIYDYPQPADEHPFAFFTEISDCPWNEKNHLLHIGIQGKKIPKEQLPPNNLVFLIDVSGSMNDSNKLPLLKSAFKLLVNELRQEDKVAIAVYAGAAGLVLPSTTGADKNRITEALEKLSAGGSTAGSAGIKLAYETAKKYYNPEGNNRVILATDGDFNVGPSSDSELIRLIEEKRDEGIFLTVLGFGMGNYKDSKMEKIADKGNGNYAYIDTIKEAEKVLINQMGGTLFTIAKDVKIQIEFNPALVDSYRLIGYENRKMAKEDFSDDTKDAGELGAGHTVTALYEIIPFKINDSGMDLKYQETKLKENAYNSGEIATLKFRYKKPDKNISSLIEISVQDTDLLLSETSNNFRFSASVAEWGMLLNNSLFKGEASYDHVLKLAKDAQGDDPQGYRKDFITIVESCIRLAKEQ